MFSPTLPKDPHLLLSMVNMKLRNEFENLEDLAHHYHLDPKEIVNALALHGFHYDHDRHQFIQR